MSSRRCALLFGALLLAAVPTLRAETASAGADPPPATPPADKKPDPPRPPGDTITLSQEDFQKRLDLALHEGKTRFTPTECRLKEGTVNGAFVQFKADFDFHAERADAVFALVCAPAKVRAVEKVDGRTPMLWADDHGSYFVQVDKPGDYTVTLHLSVPLVQRPGGVRGLELELPRAVVTSIDLTLPPDSRAVRVNGKDAADLALTAPPERPTVSGALGTLDKLDLSWQGPPPAGVPPLRTVQGRTTVRVEGGVMTTEATLTLRAQAGAAAEWTVIVPHGFTVSPSAADLARVKPLTQKDDPAGVAWTVAVKAPGADALTLTVTGRTPLAAGKRAAVGPFLVREASRQSGVVLVGAAGPDAAPLLHPHADMTPRDPTDDERKADPALFKAYDYAAAPAAPWLEVEAAAAGGVLRAQTAYALKLGSPAPGGRPEWQVAATFTVTSTGRAPVDPLDVQLPADCEFIPSSPTDVTVAPDEGNGNRLHVSVKGQPTGPLVFSIQARYVEDLGEEPRQGRMRFALPYLQPPPTRELQDGGVQIDAVAPADVELSAPAGAEVKDPHQFSWRSSQTVREKELSWQPYTPAVRVGSVIHLTIHGRWAEVRHEMHLKFQRAAPAQITLRTPAAIGASLKVLEPGAVLDAPPPGATTRVLKLAGAGPEQVVTLQYTFPVSLPPVPPGEKGKADGAGPSLTVPLATVEAATRDSEQLVRVWCDPGRLPLPPDPPGAWQELARELLKELGLAGRLPLPPDPPAAWQQRHIERVPDVPELPVLELHSDGPGAPLTLPFSADGSAASVLVDRALLRADLKGDAWEIRASYLVRQLAGDSLDIELPDGLSAPELHAKLDGDTVEPETVAPADDGPARRVARLRLGADLFLKPAVLELRYKLPARGVFENTLTPPRLVGEAGQPPTRWRVTLPPEDVALAPEGGAAVRWTVGLRGQVLPAPRLAVTDDELEQWFAGGDAGGDPTTPSLVCWADAGRPVSVVFVPETVWLAVCSLPLVFLGLLLFYLARRSHGGSRVAAFFFWLLVLPLAPAVAALWVFRPTVLYAVAFGCEPGAAVLLLFLTFQALMLERYRRRIVFLPNFRRSRSGSSLVRPNGAARPSGEPSTVDAPRPAGSSQPAAG